jgi:hypothetical protein
MAIVFTDLMPPRGPIDPIMFAGMERRDVEARITGYIEAALLDSRIAPVVPESAQDAVVIPFVKWMAYRDLYIALNSKAATVSIAERGSSAFLIEQIRNIKELMDDALSEFNDLLPDVGIEVLFPDTLTTKTDVILYAGKPRA